MKEHEVQQENPVATEFQRGQDGLFATCDSLQMKSDDERLSVAWWKTTSPVTSPGFDTPACKAWFNGEEVWEPVFLLRR